MDNFEFVEGDTGSILKVPCVRKDTKAVIPLTGATVSLIWTDSAGALQTKTMDIVDAANGITQYQFKANELFAPKMVFTIQIVDGSGNVLHNLEYIEVPVRRKQTAA